MRVRTSLILTAAIAGAVAAPASAKSVDVDVIAKGLDNPRHVAVSPSGDVYVAESGRGGNHATSRSCFDSAEGFACTGATGAVTRISRGHGHGGHHGHRGHRRGDHGRRGRHANRFRQERIARGLASFAPVSGGSAIGPHGIFVRGGDVFVTNGGPTGPTRGEPPVLVLRDPTLVAEEPISALYGTLLKLRKQGGPSRSPTSGASSATSTRTPASATRSSTATPSTCSSTAAASSSPTRAATRSCAPPSAARSRP